MRERIDQGLTALGVNVPGAADKLAQYGELLIEKNKVMNLTAITAPNQVADLHFLDSAALLGAAEFGGKRVIDVGTGAGFPGLALKLLEPSIQLTLLDGLQKRLDWLGELSAVLGAEGVEFVHGRAEEECHKSTYREAFDLATARAVADLRLLAELCLPFVKVGGRFLAMKSVDSGAETAAADGAIRLLGGTLLPSYDYTIPGTDITHRVVVIEKTLPTPAEYPRRWAKIQKYPL